MVKTFAVLQEWWDACDEAGPKVRPREQMPPPRSPSLELLVVSADGEIGPLGLQIDPAVLQACLGTIFHYKTCKARMTPNS